VDRDYLTQGDYELEVATERVPCRIHLEPLYDPRMSRIKV
jgi:4-methylaminobutanoate oxidase (formaldehyde-forming)